jgi:hypothetical protein
MRVVPLRFQNRWPSGVNSRDPGGHPCQSRADAGKDGKISLLAIILIFFGILIPVALMIFVWKIISKSDPYTSDDDPGR